MTYMKTFSVIKDIFDFLLWMVIFVFVGLVAVNWISQRPNSPLPFLSFVIQSGSMEPTIMTGDMIVDRTDRAFGVDTIITFKDPQGHTITHRIIKIDKSENGSLGFITKGDNNEDPDGYVTPPSKVLGTWWFTIPKLGYILVYSRSFFGITVIVSLFAGWIVSEQVWNYLRKKQKAREEASGE